MDPTAAANGNKSGSGFSKPSKPPSGPARRNTPRTGPVASTAKLQQNLLRQIGGDTSRLPNGPRATRSQANTTTIKIFGLKASKAATNPDGGVKSLLEFLERKASGLSNHTVTIKKSLVIGDFVYVLASNEDSEEILKLNTFSFAGTNLNITKNEDGWPQRIERQTGSTMSEAAKQSKQRLQGVLEQRYDMNAKLLNLSALGQDPTLMEMGLFQDKGLAEKTFKVLMAICQDLFKSAKEKREAIQSVSLANNGIDFVGQIFELADTFPDLKHLDLSGNQFQHTKQLQRWRGHFKHLETLLLLGNPIIEAEPGHANDFMSWFPKLQNLNGAIVRTPEQIAAAEAAMQAKPIPQNGTDFRDVAGLGEQFIRQFIPMYDSDRAALAAAFYDEETRFTLAVSNHTPRGEQDAPVLPWAPYLKFSRNHGKITTVGARMQRYFVGVNFIQDLWKQLPATKHPDLVAEVNKYIIDCHGLPGLRDPTGQSNLGVDGMIITVHGEFQELDAATGKTGMRSFSRTFTLGPGQPGRNAIRVNSDMLSLRAWSPVPSIVPSAAPVAAVMPPAAPAAAISEEQQKDMMILELSNRTNMTLEYSKMCLDTAGWDFDRAVAVFEEKRAVLGPEAFKPTA